MRQHDKRRPEVGIGRFLLSPYANPRPSYATAYPINDIHPLSQIRHKQPSSLTYHYEFNQARARPPKRGLHGKDKALGKPSNPSTTLDMKTASAHKLSQNRVMRYLLTTDSYKVIQKLQKPLGLNILRYILWYAKKKWLSKLL